MPSDLRTADESDNPAQYRLRPTHPAHSQPTALSEENSENLKRRGFAWIDPKKP